MRKYALLVEPNVVRLVPVIALLGASQDLTRIIVNS